MHGNQTKLSLPWSRDNIEKRGQTVRTENGPNFFSRPARPRTLLCRLQNPCTETERERCLQSAAREQEKAGTDSHALAISPRREIDLPSSHDSGRSGIAKDRKIGGTRQESWTRASLRRSRLFAAMGTHVVPWSLLAAIATTPTPTSSYADRERGPSSVIIHAFCCVPMEICSFAHHKKMEPLLHLSFRLSSELPRYLVITSIDWSLSRMCRDRFSEGGEDELWSREELHACMLAERGVLGTIWWSTLQSLPRTAFPSGRVVPQHSDFCPHQMQNLRP